MGIKKIKLYGNYTRRFPQPKFRLYEQTEGEVYRLRILNVSGTDQGFYTCRVHEIRKYRNIWRAWSNGSSTTQLTGNESYCHYWTLASNFTRPSSRAFKSGFRFHGDWPWAKPVLRRSSSTLDVPKFTIVYAVQEATRGGILTEPSLRRLLKDAGYKFGNSFTRNNNGAKMEHDCSFPIKVSNLILRCLKKEVIDYPEVILRCVKSDFDEPLWWTPRPDKTVR